ncbi:hypothetical protein H9Y04_29735 [Streptomyces sp. TRM66268-LWL]|uniref:Secreted protein n=1 Tax=Streptomyces polyasparticus TaxID=2767826 RepID=A0ABR7SQW3_9ACTN|nr:hypothetical protein [Streptomyces polyasparticus]MBC9716723.1 hypothetical protein [Streptomyces polyasparticus]
MVGAAALHTVRGLNRQISALRSELAADRAAAGQARVPAARSAADHPDTDAIRIAVSEALAEERERELAEARAFWAAQEARDAADAPSLLGSLPPNLAEELFLPRQSDFVGLERELGFAEGELELAEEPAAADEYPGDSPELAAARRRHPSHPDFVPVQAMGNAKETLGGDHEHTAARLAALADARTALCDVRPGPLGTLDVYVFTDGTTLCMTPGHRETAERLAAALRGGDTPVLLGGSGVSGAYSLTFACGDENVYILADRVIASA